MMWSLPSTNSQKRTRPNETRTRRRYMPLVELLENRELLANNFLQGTAFHDNNQNGVLDLEDTYKAGATIELRSADGTTLLAQTTTDANGAYRFDDPLVLTPGTTYRLVEIPTPGYVNAGTQILSQLHPATSIGLNTIQVTLANTDNLKATLDIDAFFASGLFEVVDYSIDGFTRDSGQTSAGQMPGTLTGLSSPVSILTFCTDIFNDLDTGVNGPYSVMPGPEPVGTSALFSAERLGRKIGRASCRERV